MATATTPEQQQRHTKALNEAHDAAHRAFMVRTALTMVSNTVVMQATTDKRLLAKYEKMHAQAVRACALLDGIEAQLKAIYNPFA